MFWDVGWSPRFKSGECIGSYDGDGKNDVYLCNGEIYVVYGPKETDWIGFQGGKLGATATCLDWASRSTNGFASGLLGILV